MKGTAGDGSEILLTPNEVEHARAFYPSVALFIVADVAVAGPEGEAPTASGGRVILLSPWLIDGDCLRPVGYSYSIPVGPVRKRRKSTWGRDRGTTAPS